jgi:hypothetical protein
MLNPQQQQAYLSSVAAVSSALQQSYHAPTSVTMVRNMMPSHHTMAVEVTLVKHFVIINF